MAASLTRYDKQRFSIAENREGQLRCRKARGRDSLRTQRTRQLAPRLSSECFAMSEWSHNQGSNPALCGLWLTTYWGKLPCCPDRGIADYRVGKEEQGDCARFTGGWN